MANATSPAYGQTVAQPGAQDDDQAMEIRLLVLGDSLTHGYGLADGDTFPAQLEAALHAAGHNVAVINGGVSGDTTAGGLARLDWALADDPDIVMIELGANDALRIIDPQVSRQNLAAILEELDRRGVPALLAGMLAPPNLGGAYVADFNAIYPDLAAMYDVPLYPFFLEGVATEPGLNQSDGIHPNAAGVAVIVENITPFVVEGLVHHGLLTAERG